jgi:DNA-directed RNA polymerase subunit RPC12/RpoP
MSDQDNIYICSRCSHKFEFCPQPAENEDTSSVEVKCPKCGTGYVRKVFTFPKDIRKHPILEGLK